MSSATRNFAGIGLCVLAAAWSSTASGAETSATALMAFQLPLPGEAIPAEGGGLLVEADSTIRQVLFNWSGPETGSAEGTVQVDGYFQAHTPPLKSGKWTLEAQGFDAQGKLVTRLSQTFEVGETQAPGKVDATAGVARVTQGLYVSGNLGAKFGIAENTLQSYRSLKLTADGRSIPGPEREPFDQILSGNALMAYHLQQGDFRLKLRTSTDLSETWGHSASPSRFGADLFWKDWAEAHVGDQYPAWSQMLMDGTRIRGAGIGLALRNEGDLHARADFAVGSLRPAVDPQIRTWGGVIDTLPAQFSRSIQAFHIGFGDGTPVGLNFAFVHVKDKTNDVDLDLHDSLGGSTPRENAAIGADFVTRLWRNRVELYCNSAFAITTEDTRQGSILDSLRNKEDLPLPEFLDGISTVNLSTKGVELFARGGSGAADYTWQNLALRTGASLIVPLGRAGRLRLDSRWVHFGAGYQSLARSVQESPRTGVEWSATTSLVNDALLLVVSGSEVDKHPDFATSLPTHALNANLAWTPVAAPVGFHAQSGTNNSGGGDVSRSEAWNGGGGLFGAVKTREYGSIFWRTGYNYYTNALRTPLVSMDTIGGVNYATRQHRTEVMTHSLEANLRWRPLRDLEGRSGYTLASQGFPGDTIQVDQTQTHRFQGGVSSWHFGHKLEIALDASMVYRPQQPEENATGWDQVARVSWNVGDSKTLRLAQRWARLSGGRHDVRVEAGWEAWY
ncbi:MAG: hypothetical protein RL173_3070 [Fibrobacterota bacterium]|jgi:hypothetical protein